MNSYVTAVVMILVVYAMINIIIKPRLINEKITNREPADWKLSCSECPDIYYIILDSYTSQESLRKHWNFGNERFCNEIKKINFFLADSSRSKFTATPYSLYSSLNMDGDSLRVSNLHLFEVLDGIKQNTVASKLSEAGYDVVNLSLFDFLSTKRYYDYSNFNNDSNSIINRLINNTALAIFFTAYQSHYLYETNLSVLDSLYSLAKKNNPAPRFVYAHLMSPHFPFTMDSLGRYIPLYQQKYISNPEGYLQQLKGLNKKLFPMIEHIIKEKKRPALVILQGDHGFRFFGGKDGKVEASSIMNAYYLPSDSDQLYKTISPYNTFRFIFNNFFGTKLKILKD